MGSIQEPGIQNFALAGVEPHPHQTDRQRVSRQSLLGTTATRRLFRVQNDHLIGRAVADKGFDCLAKSSLDPHPKVSLLALMQGEQPEGRITPIVNHQIVAMTAAQMAGGQAALTHLDRCNPGIDDEIVERIVVTRNQRHRTRFARRAIAVYPEVLANRRCVGQSTLAAVDGTNPKAFLPCLVSAGS